MKSSSVVMMPFSVVYGAVTRLRHAAYRHGLFSTVRLNAPVISVGNITTGGTGKTPLVEWVCRRISEVNVEKAVVGKDPKRPRTCVLTRGYGRVDPERQVVVSDGVRILTSERDAGDEPLWLAKNLLGIAAVVCNRDRVTAGEWAIQNLGAEVFVLDDGFQHLRIARDLDILTIDVTNPWAGGVLLPEGRLREPLENLSRADCIVLTRCDQLNDLSSIKSQAQQFAVNVPILCSRMVVKGTRSLSGQAIEPSEVSSQPVLAFCGIGNPEAFFKQLRQEGFPLAGVHAFWDHHNYTQLDLDSLVREARTKGAESLITTAKDAIKLETLDCEMPCYVLDIQISIDDETRLVEMLRDVVSSKRDSND